MAIFLFLFVFWLLFNGRITWDVVAFGLVISGFVTWFAVAICGWTKQNTKMILYLSGQLIVYVFCLVVEIIKANIATIKVILFPKKYEIRPRLFTFDSHLEKEELQTIMANSITITPGTYTVVIYDNNLMVHALNSEFQERTPDSALNRRLIRMQETMSRLVDRKTEGGENP